MGQSKTTGAGVVLTGRRTRVWVEQGALHWKRGRTTVVVPGTRIRKVEAAERSLAVLLFADTKPDAALTVRHRNGDVVAALGAEIEAIISDPGPSGNGQPIRRHSTRPWPLRTATGLRDRLLRGSPWWRRALWYVLLGFPLAVWLPVKPGFLGLVAWLLLPAGVAFLRLWIVMAALDTRWVMWRRGITVRARYERDPHGEADHDHIVRFRTLDGREVTAHPATRGRRDEVRYDPEDPSRVLAPTRVAWLGIALAAFMLTGIWGVAFSIPAAIWLIRLLALPF